MRWADRLPDTREPKRINRTPSQMVRDGGHHDPETSLAMRMFPEFFIVRRRERRQPQYIVFGRALERQRDWDLIPIAMVGVQVVLILAYLMKWGRFS